MITIQHKEIYKPVSIAPTFSGGGGGVEGHYSGATAPGASLGKPHDIYFQNDTSTDTLTIWEKNSNNDWVQLTTINYALRADTHSVGTGDPPSGAKLGDIYFKNEASSDVVELYQYQPDSPGSTTLEWAKLLDIDNTAHTQNFTVGTGDPVDTSGSDGDIYVKHSSTSLEWYQRVSGTWTSRGSQTFSGGGGGGSTALTTGSTDPDDNNGNNGDIYIKHLTTGLQWFQKASGSWVSQGSQSFPSVGGEIALRFGSTTPSASLGSNGDIYIQLPLITAEYARITWYQKGSGTWAKKAQYNIYQFVPSYTTGSATPSNSTGREGDLYIQISGATIKWWTKTGTDQTSGDPIWETQGTFTAPTSAAEVFKVGTANPTGGSDGDIYVKTSATGLQWYQRVSGTWTSRASWTAPASENFFTGSSTPSAGSHGDIYVKKSTAGLQWYQNVNGTWTSRGSWNAPIPANETFTVGADAPTGGSDGDIYVRTSGSVLTWYQRVSGTWTERGAWTVPAVESEAVSTGTSAPPTTSGTVGDIYFRLGTNLLTIYQCTSVQGSIHTWTSRGAFDVTEAKLTYDDTGTDPSTSDGEIGDMYFSRQSGDEDGDLKLWQKTAAAVWTNRGVYTPPAVEPVIQDISVDTSVPTAADGSLGDIAILKQINNFKVYQKDNNNADPPVPTWTLKGTIGWTPLINGYERGIWIPTAALTTIPKSTSDNENWGELFTINRKNTFDKIIYAICNVRLILHYGHGGTDYLADGFFRFETYLGSEGYTYGRSRVTSVDNTSSNKAKVDPRNPGTFESFYTSADYLRSGDTEIKNANDSSRTFPQFTTPIVSFDFVSNRIAILVDPPLDNVSIPVRIRATTDVDNSATPQYYGGMYSMANWDVWSVNT